MNESQSVSAEALLEHEPFVRAVVRGLLTDEARVQDVVQETWLRALRKPPAEGGSLRSWLARVAGNLARDSHRSEGRRRRREADAARPEAVESVEVTHRRLSAQRDVVATVLELREPYRSVVLLRYFQELTPAQVAERLERSPATVRSQLSRAHELLRDELDRRFEGGRAMWAGLLLPGFRDPPAPASGSTPWLPLGAKAVLILAGASAASWMFLVRSTQEERALLPAPPVSTVATSQASAARAGVALAPATEPEASGVRLSSTASPPIGMEDEAVDDEEPVLVGTLWLGEERLAEERLQVTHHSRQLDRTSRTARTALTTDADGRFEYRSPLLDQESMGQRLTLSLARQGPGDSHLSVDVELPAGRLAGTQDLGHVVVPVPTFVVSGIVTSTQGEPIPEATLFVEYRQGREPHGGLSGFASAGSCRTDASGRFAFYHALDPEAKCRIRTFHPGREATHREFTPGQSNLHLQLVPVAGPMSVVAVVGQVILDPLVTPAQLYVRLQGTQSSIVSLLDESAGFEFAEAPPGAYSLEVLELRRASPSSYSPVEYPEPGKQRPMPALRNRRPHMGLAPLLHSRPVDLLPRVGQDVLRLDTIDLRAALKRVVLRCEDIEGRPVPGALLSVAVQRGRNGNPIWSGIRGEQASEFGPEGRIEMLLPTYGSEQYEVTAEGFAPQLLRSVTGDTTVVLERKLVVRIEAPVALRVPSPYQMGVVLTPLTDSVVPNPGAKDFRALLDEEGQVELPVDLEGDYTLALLLIHTAEHASFRIRLGLRLQTVTILRDPAVTPQVIVAEYGREELERAFELLEESKQRSAESRK